MCGVARPGGLAQVLRETGAHLSAHKRAAQRHASSDELIVIGVELKT